MTDRDVYNIKQTMNHLCVLTVLLDILSRKCPMEHGVELFFIMETHWNTLNN